MTTLVKLRVLGSILVITAYFVILHVDATIGVIINLVAETISMPFFLKTKSWDVVFMLSFMITIGLSKLVGLIVSNALVQPIVNFLG